jgi:hypothetical protein
MLQADFLLGLFVDPEDGTDLFLRNVAWIICELHGVISQKIELFITTVIRSSNPRVFITCCYTLYIYILYLIYLYLKRVTGMLQ